MLRILKKGYSRAKYYYQLIFACQIPYRYMRRLNIPHPVGIVIASEAIVDESVLVFQNVTIGRISAYNDTGYPVLKKNCIVYAGAVVAGNIVLGEGVIVAANAVVTESVHKGTVYGYNQVVDNSTSGS